MSIDKKLKQAIELQQAQKTGHESFILLKKLDELEDKIENIPQTDLTKIEDTLNTLTNKVNEDIEVELQIV
jgi:hypothetical protein